MKRKIFAGIIGMFSASVMAQPFEMGQVWQYKTRLGEESSRLYIVKVEALTGGQKIFHIYADNLKINNPMLAKGIQTELPHAPVSEQTLKLSVTKLQQKTENLPDISEGYAAWKEAYDQGGAGMFTISVSEIITIIEETISQHAKPNS